jgi:hypothetical protein
MALAFTFSEDEGAGKEFVQLVLEAHNFGCIDKIIETYDYKEEDMMYTFSVYYSSVNDKGARLTEQLSNPCKLNHGYDFTTKKDIYWTIYKI